MKATILLVIILSLFQASCASLTDDYLRIRSDVREYCSIVSKDSGVNQRKAMGKRETHRCLREKTESALARERLNSYLWMSSIYGIIGIIAGIVALKEI